MGRERRSLTQGAPGCRDERSRFGSSSNVIENAADTEFARPVIEVFLVENAPLKLVYANCIPNLTLAPATRSSPFEFLQDGVLGRRDRDVSTERSRLDPPNKPACIEWLFRQRPEIDLIARCGIDEVEHAATRESIFGSSTVEEVRVGAERLCERIDNAGIEFDDQIDVMRRARLALKA